MISSLLLIHMHEQDKPYHADGSPTDDPYDGMSWLAKYASQRSIFVMSRIRFFGDFVYFGISRK
ncbi:hypothetical protein G153_02245 [Megasphaera sp. BL7]|nr:hypothetical protein NM10_10450 [Megasphaera sp. NM10]EPP17449.1 hypothetical protein G153_02245 [Megasphaera sp. BL7]